MESSKMKEGETLSNPLIFATTIYILLEIKIKIPFSGTVGFVNTSVWVLQLRSIKYFPQTESQITLQLFLLLLNLLKI